MDRPPAAAAIAYARGKPHVLLALDAPLGWPKAMGPALSRHVAGRHLDTAANLLFRRETDRFIRDRLGKQSLDVGADRIARTAWAALDLLQTIRNELHEDVPLAWSNEGYSGVKAIEVYPAGTLKAYSLKSSGYKRPGNRLERSALISALRRLVNIDVNDEVIKNSSHALDAVVCVVAGSDFLRGYCQSPELVDTVAMEGWIWVRDQLAPADARRVCSSSR